MRMENIHFSGLTGRRNELEPGKNHRISAVSDQLAGRTSDSLSFQRKKCCHDYHPDPADRCDTGLLAALSQRARTFFRTLFLYVILGGATGMGLVMSDSYVSSSNAGAVMILMIMAAAGVYSIVFWLINRQLKHYEIMHLK